MALIVRGPDVSSVQGYPGRGVAPDWERVKRAGYDFAICKAIEGNADTPDPSFAYNWPHIAAADLIRGCYPFTHADTIHTNDAADEAKRCVGQIGRFGGFRPGIDFIAGDFEDRYTVQHGLPNGEPFVRWMVDWGETIESESGATPFAYSGGPYYAEHAGPSISAELLARVRRFPLWIPAYVDDPEIYVSMTPWRALGWTLWQRSGDFSAHGGPGARIPGIACVVDENVFRGTPDSLRALIRSLRVSPVTESGLVMGTPNAAATSIADEAHRLATLWAEDSDPPDTLPDTQAAKRKSSDRLQAVNAPIIDPDATLDGEKT